MARSSPTLAAALANVTVKNVKALSCGVCCLPLKPPIFQCDVRHAVCSSCRDKRAPAGRCDECRGRVSGGYRRCDAMEKLVESVQVPCKNAAYGCATRTTYYDHLAHHQSCAHAPCHCPAEACGFASSTAALLVHLTTEHNWPCTEVRSHRPKKYMVLRDGFNVISVDDACDRNLLFLLMVSRERLGRAISAVCVSSPPDTVRLKFGIELTFELFLRGSAHGDRVVSTFHLASTDLSNGLPDPNACFQFVVPHSVVPVNEKAIKIGAEFYTTGIPKIIGEFILLPAGLLDPLVENRAFVQHPESFSSGLKTNRD
ncbi:hypothetical protein ACQ4PT_039097 [Festuca glaucescens]